MKLRLKDSISFDKMITPYGVVTHEWKEFPNGVYVYKELEVFGQEENKPEPVTSFSEPAPIVNEIEEKLDHSFVFEITKLRGLGVSAESYIKRNFKNEEQFIKALSENKVDLRSDIVETLKRHYGL